MSAIRRLKQSSSFWKVLAWFKILKDEEPNATTIKAIEEVKSGKTYKASSLDDMLNYLRN